MIIVDTSVWIDYFIGRDTPQVNTLDGLLNTAPLGIGDLILVEVLQGFRSDNAFQLARDLLSSLTLFEMLGLENAVWSADLYRTIRKKGLSIHKMSDVIIASFRITEGHDLLFSDHGFDLFVAHFGLRAVS